MFAHNNSNNSSSSSVPSSSEPLISIENANSNSFGKRKRRPAGTPDPDAEVVALSPRRLLESDRYVCEICNQGFQRDQNLQMHRRRHKVPWKLLKRENPVVRKRVFVCPEPTCLHHDPCHALGDLVGIKKHFRRKHSNHKQWVCDKCSKAYAVQSDYKAHLKTCGTRGHSCDCGRVFSRVESFIEHQDACHTGCLRLTDHHSQGRLQTTVCLSRTASSPSPSSDTNFNRPAPWSTSAAAAAAASLAMPKTNSAAHCRNLELQLSIGSSELSDKNESSVDEAKGTGAGVVKEDEAEQLLKLAMAEKAYAEEARREAMLQIELAEWEFASAKKTRQQAQVELDKAQALKEQAVKKISSTLLQITCHACKQQFQATTASPHHDDPKI
ncbi:hypothetical protein Nepgr_015927 [Nepenthes gracilis]|uniref:C2H2-type domain-containing protein n=1 Tax=Nepenthes gracilis TaxID=150966 RepID=A0AAD3XRR9_NEPGR|nr:hypothetical protein Nepgr_015927 [Nepenthes gracilis]